MRILLFDIDGTLLMTNGGGSSAIKLAIEQEFGVPDACTNIGFSGRTDRSLIVELLARNGLPVGEAFQDRLAQRYKALFPDVLACRGGRLLPGARELLDRLSAHPDLRCYVMTGNMQATATRKLDHFGLLGFFRGIFGGDLDHDRNQLAARTAEALRDRYGATATRDMIVIGDTPADIRCGHAIGASVVAVCTGNFARMELEAENPMQVHDDLSDVGVIFDALTGARSTSNGKRR